MATWSTITVVVGPMARQDKPRPQRWHGPLAIEGWDAGAGHYTWMSGSYVVRPTQEASWTPAHWAQQPGGWMWLGRDWN